MAATQPTTLLRQIRKLAEVQASSAQTDSQLLQLFIADRNESAFTTLLHRHGPKVLDVCRTVLHHQQDAEDVFQATFLLLANKADSIRKQPSLGSWLHGVAYRLALKARAQADRRRTLHQQVQQQPAASPLDDLTVRELRGVLHEELHRLPEKYRAVLLLCYWDGKTRDEAAEQLGWTKGTCKERLERARNLLRSRLTRRGLLPSATVVAALLADNVSRAALPASLADATAKGAVAFAAGQPAVAGASSSATALAQQAIRSMPVSRGAKILLVLVLLGVAGTGLGLWAGNHTDEPAVVAQAPPAPKLVATPPDKPEDPVKKELNALEGVWELAARSKDGAAQPMPAGDRPRLIIKNGRYLRQLSYQSSTQGKIQFDPAANPRTIDIFIGGIDGRRIAPLPLSGIYALKGDELRISCAAKPGMNRPAKMESRKGSGQAIETWKRVGPDARQQADKIVREIGLGGIRRQPAKTRFSEPTIIGSAAALAKIFPDKQSRERLNKQVDFAKEQLAFFAWSGSSGDWLWFRIAWSAKNAAKKPVVVFRYTGGPEADSVPQFHLYAITKDSAGWKVETK